MDGAEKALTELAEPLARLFERWTGIAVDPALCAAIIAMSLVLVGAFAGVTAVAMTRRLWRLWKRQTPRSIHREAPRPSLEGGVEVRAAAVAEPGPALARETATTAPIGQALATDKASGGRSPLPAAAPSRPVSLRPRPLPKAAPKRATPRLVAARKVRDAVMLNSHAPGWSANADVPALTSREMRSIDGIALRIELMAPEAGAPIHTLNIWSDGAKVFNFEWSEIDEKAEKLRFFKAGDWADDIAAWRFAGSLPARDLRRAEGGR